MATVVTLSALKAAERDRRVSAVAELGAELSAYAAEKGGRYLLYGSAARGTMRHDSDVDILADFPPDAIDDAWIYAEEACWRRRLPPDIRPRSWVGGDFLDHIGKDIKVLA
jgi:tRNA nucleotidyltransferase (CCA-adding enzyme)